MKGIVFTVLMVGFLCSFQLCGQTPIDVAENTIKVGGLDEEVFYYGFAEGDQMIFNFKEADGKELKELEIIELPSSSKFMDYKVKKIENKVININRTGIYKFKLSNSAITGRVCKIKIQRIPASDATKNFNTSVYWRTIQDTSYTPTEEKYLVKSDTSAQSVVDQISKISSQTALNGNPNRTIVDFTLPDGTISWGYYIGVGSEGKEAFDAAKENFLNTAASVASKIPGYGSMAALALYGMNVFNKVQGRDNVKYWFITDWDNVQLFESGNEFYQYKQGNVVNDASQMKSPLSGKVYIGLLNDNVMEPIEVMVKVTAIVVNQQWATHTIQLMKVENKKEPYLKD
ncbi:MAG: hypothetical protein GYA51_10720 [Candidatus Methanofastidiosa archaeon]|nr:hypothetical protein [Candidatus Methanofastidiosa archaeon]